MGEKSLHAVAPVEESVLPCMPNKGLVRALTRFTSGEIKKLMYQGKLVYTDACLDIKLQKTSQPFSKILVITPRKIGSAPQRNLLKRRLRSIFYEEHLYERGSNLAIFCKKGSPLLPFARLKEILLSLYTLQVRS